MRPLHLGLLGTFSARWADGATVTVRRRKARALLSYLALRRGEPQPREKLMALLWGDADAERARHSLRQTLTVLRHDLGALPGAPALLVGDAVCLDPTLVSVDVDRFERLADSATPEGLEMAATLYRGDFLEGLEAVGETFEGWLGTERDRLRTMAGHVLDRLLAAHMALGATQPAIDTAIRLLGIDPLREDVHRLLIRLHAREGRRTAALRQYRTCAAMLRRELDVAPEDETTDLYRAIVAAGPAGSTPGNDVVRLHCLAAEGAVTRSAFPRAAASLDHALRILDGLPESRNRLAAEVDVRLGFERVLMPLGEIDRLREHLRAAEEGALALRDRVRLGWVRAHRMSCDLWTGDAEVALRAGEQALQTAMATGHSDLRLVANCRLAQAHYYIGDFRQGARIAGDVMAASPAGELSLGAASQGALPAVHLRAYLSLCLTALGGYGQARVAALEGVQLAERAGHDWSRAFALCGLGTCDLQQARPREASESFAIAQALERAEDGARRFVLPGAPIGMAHALAGRRVEGIELIESTLRVSTARGFGTFRQRGLAGLARCRLRQGRFGEALAHAEEALQLARDQRQRAGEAWALHLLAEILARAGAGEASWPRAYSACLDSLDRAEALGMRPLVAHCHGTLADLWDRAGDAKRARSARAAAAAVFHELGLVGATS